MRIAFLFRVPFSGRFDVFPRFVHIVFSTFLRIFSTPGRKNAFPKTPSGSQFFRLFPPNRSLNSRNNILRPLPIILDSADGKFAFLAYFYARFQRFICLKIVPIRPGRSCQICMYYVSKYGVILYRNCLDTRNFYIYFYHLVQVVQWLQAYAQDMQIKRTYGRVIEHYSADPNFRYFFFLGLGVFWR